MTRFARIAVLAGVLVLSACGGAPSTGSGAGSEVQREASVRLGDTVARASVLPTASLGEAVAKQYGIERDASTARLLVGVRRGSDAQETAVTARITATATDLLGKRQAIELHEVRSGTFVDYVGTVTVIAPDTLSFDVTATPEGGAQMKLQFNRDFF